MQETINIIVSENGWMVIGCISVTILAISAILYLATLFMGKHMRKVTIISLTIVILCFWFCHYCVMKSVEVHFLNNPL